MTAIADQDTPNELRDWESPGRLLRRYLSAAGMQAIGTVLCAVGFVVLAFGWWKISQESIVALQIPYLVSGGIGGALLLGMGGVLLIAHDLRLDHRRLEVIEASLNELRDAFLADVGSVEPVAASVASGAPAGNGAPIVNGVAPAGFVKVAGGKRYHAASCAVAAGKEVTAVDPGAVNGLLPCRLCAPA